MDTQKLSEISQSQIKRCDQIVATSEIIPLSEAQKQLWILCQLGTEGSIKYNKSISLQLHGLLNFSAMERAIQKVVNRHEAMRTTISQEDDSQRIQPSLKVDVPLVDFSNIGLVERDSKVAEWLRKQSREPFDFTQGPLFRFYLLRLEEQLHFLVMTTHHIIIDDWSVSLILQELSALYSSECQGIDCTLDSPLQFREYIELQTQAFNTEDMVGHESYWLEQFAESIPVLDIPTDWTRPSIKTYNGSKETVKLDANLCSQIKKVSQEKGYTLFMILFSAYTVLLHRLTDQDDILVGIPTAGRSLKGSENLVGYCSNTLLIRSHIVGEPKFSDYLKTINKKLSDAYEHQDYPFAKLINKLNFNRSSPLVTTTFNLDQPLKAQFFELKTSLFPQPFSFTNYDLHCNVIETEDELVLDCFYNTDLFAPETIKRWLGHFECLLQAIVVNPDQYLTKLPLLTDSQCHQLLVEWNDTKCDYAADKCIHQLFEDQTEKTPDAVAVMFENQMLTYRQLNQKANQLAHYLQSLGVKQEVLVGICLQPSIDLVVGLLGILKAGGAYVPLDPEYPQERLSYMLADANVKVLLIQGNLTVNIPPQHAHIVYLDRDRDAIGRESVENLENKTILDDLAYAIYTSGSTGKPKAVLGKIRGIINRLHWMWETLPFAADEICVQKTSINFVDHVAEIFSPLLKGIPLVIVPNHIRADIPQLMSLLSEQKITRIVLVPSLLKAMLENTPQQLTQLRYLKYVFCSGEALPLTLAKAFHQKINSARLFNLYGSSEVAADVTCFEVNPWETRQRILQYFKPEVVHGATKNSVFGVQQQPFTKPGVSPEILATKFQRSELPLQPLTVDDYYDKFSQEVLPYTINTGTPTFIGHMTSALPDFMHDMSKMISRLNQNLVKIETSKSLIFLEREAIAILHRLLYRFSDEFYQENIQHKSRNLGIITTGGTTANITALLCARNSRLLRQENSDDLSTESLYKVLHQKGYNDIVIIGSRLMHYSFNKAGSMLGLGTDNIIFIDSNDNAKLDINHLKEKIYECRRNKLYILAIVGIAGTTETGEIDPLSELADIAREFGIHFHVDAAWGGATIFSEKHKGKLKGINKADSITICGHKQLYLPQGISVCLFKDPQMLRFAETTARYQSQRDTFDMGRFTIEGSRSALSLCLHGALHIIGKRGYEILIDNSIEKAQYFARLIQLLEPFELIMEPVLNIVNYRYIPEDLRTKALQKALLDDDIHRINQLNTQIQREQFEQGQTFVSKTILMDTSSGKAQEIVVFRAVLCNPNTTAADLHSVLEDQLRIANQIEAKSQEKFDDLKNIPVKRIGSSDTEAAALLKTIHLQLAAAPKADFFADIEEYLQKNIVSIGKPIANTQIYILDKYGNPQPQGITGELYVGGDGVAAGYLNLPELTQQKFILNQFTKSNNNSKTAAEERLFRTGDLARWLPNGNIEFVGRIDHQVKIRGFRIELEEIEAVLHQHPDVEEAVVIAREDIPGDKRLVAYFVSKIIPDRLPYQTEGSLVFDDQTWAIQTEDISQNGVGLTFTSANPPEISSGQQITLNLRLPGEEENSSLTGIVIWWRSPQAGISFQLTAPQLQQIRQSVKHLLEKQELLKILQRTITRNLLSFLKTKLPDYMLPSSFVLLEAMPLTPNGKVDRRALPAPEIGRSQIETAYVKPQNEIENIIARVWQDTLQIDKVGIHDNFFDLGGHSLLMAQVSQKLLEALEQKISIVQLFQFPTIHSLAEHLSPSLNQGQVQSLVSKSNTSKERASKRLNRREENDQQRQRRKNHD